VLIGLQMPSIVVGLRARPLGHLVLLTVLVCLAVVAIRFVWVFLTDLPRLLRRFPGAWREDIVVSWAGMRGVVSLAAALALPFALNSGDPLPERDLLIFLTLCVILVTLVGQGLSLPWVMRALHVRTDGVEAHEEAFARDVATRAARDRIEALSEEWPGHLPLIETLRTQYEHRLSHLASDSENGQQATAEHTDAEQELIEHRAIRHAVIEAERAAVLELRDTGQINDDVLRSLERELDLEELRMEA